MNTIEELVLRVLNGDMKAFEELYNQTSKQVYYTCYSFLGNEQDSLDVMQDTYLAALTHLNELENKSRFCQWINKIAVNKSKTVLGRKQPMPIEEEIFETIPVDAEDNFLPENYVTNQEKRQLVLRIMSETLTAAQYQTVILYYFDGMTAQEIAECMGCSVGTVTSRLSWARAKIKQGVENYQDISGEKLYSVGGMPLLSAVLMAEAEGLVVPNVLSHIMNMATETAGVLTQGFMTVAEGFSNINKGSGKGALFATTKAKLVAGIVAVAVVGGGIATVAVLGGKDGKKTDTTTEGLISTEIDSDTEIDINQVAQETLDNYQDTPDVTSGEAGGEIIAPETTEEENDLSDEPLPLLEHYGDENYFAFSAEGKNYIFTSTETVKLFSTSGGWDETYENIVSEPISFMVLIDGKPMNQLNLNMADFEDKRGESEIVYEEGGHHSL